MSYLQITSGRGPAECQRAVWHMVRYLQKELPTLKLVEHEAGYESDCFKSVILRAVEGTDIERFKGSHVWICPSPFRPNHKRKRWFFGIEPLPKSDELVLNLKEVRLDTFRGSGPGGQHINTTNSAVRATWVPEGISVIASGERSQHRNKQLALARLQQVTSSLQDQQSNQSKKEAWDIHNQLKRGKAVLTFKEPEFIYQK